ncbi:MAG TPA: hypothetical protein DEZ27_01085 [Sphaerochaeta sp.]|nr:hypothetical protein [Sphaerochaeta sp.]
MVIGIEGNPCSCHISVPGRNSSLATKMGKILVFLQDFRKSVTRKEILVLHIEFLVGYFF